MYIGYILYDPTGFKCNILSNWIIRLILSSSPQFISSFSLNAIPRSCTAHAGVMGSWVEMAFTRSWCWGSTCKWRGGCFSIHFYRVCRDHLTERSWTACIRSVPKWSSMRAPAPWESYSTQLDDRHTSHPTVSFVYLCSPHARWALDEGFFSCCQVERLQCPTPLGSALHELQWDPRPRGLVLALIQGVFHLHVSTFNLYHLSLEKSLRGE